MGMARRLRVQQLSKNQWMGDAAYVLYQETNEPVYLRLAEFYERSARLLASAQTRGTTRV